MKFKLFLVSIFICLFTSIAIAGYYEDVNVIIENLTTNEMGAGTLVSENIIVSCGHLITRNDDFLFVLQDGIYYPITVLKRYEEYDLSILYVEHHQFNTFSMILNRRLKRGENIVAVGNPLGFEDSITEGRILAYGFSKWKNYICHSAKIAPGNSGGGLFWNRFLIGVNIAYFDNFEGYYIAESIIPIINDIQKYIKEYEANR